MEFNAGNDSIVMMVLLPLLCIYFGSIVFFLTKRTSVYEFFNKKSEKVLKVNHKRGSSTCGFKTDAESINFAPYFLCYRSVGCLQGLCSLATEPEPSPAATSMTSGTVILIKKEQA